MAELTETQIELWVLLMKETPFSTAQRRMREHIMSNKFPPTIADIVRIESQPDHLTLISETEFRLADMERQEQLAIECPEHLIPRFLKDGVNE